MLSIKTSNVMNTTDVYRIEALLEIAAAYPEALTAAEVARRRRIPAPFLGRLLAEAGKAPEYAAWRGWLLRAYEDFVGSSAQQEKVFAVFRKADGSSFMPLSSLGD